MVKRWRLTRECYVFGLRTIFRVNWGVPSDTLDYHAEVDYSLSYAENYSILYYKLRKLGYIQRQDLVYRE